MRGSAARGATDALEEYRGGPTGCCYQVLGSYAEAEGAVQETMVRAWRRRLGRGQAAGSVDGLLGISAFRDTEQLFPLFGLPARTGLDAAAGTSAAARPTRPTV
ncbi:hypothetical protein ACIQD1_15485 [Streptomyces sp. NPDC093088]|uniref:hypothetical protein n=1 Tax=Streptomyces sp. NPDC093088 TaxID=3366023 RepID=UPI0037FC62EE